MIACYGNNIHEIKKLIQRQVTFLKQYDALVNLYTLDYFVCNHWGKIPSSWQRALLQLEVQDFGDFLDLNKEFKCKKSPLPLSLLAFRASVSSLSLPRQSENAVKLLDEFLYKAYGFEKSNLEKFQCKEAKDEFLSLSQKCSSQHKDLPKVCRRHVKLKKQHEICHIAQLACLALQKVKVNCVMDIGSGLGHLSRLLSLEYDLKVTTIEAESGHVSLATNLDKKAIMHLQKELNSKIVNSDDAFSVTANEICNKELPQHVENVISLSTSHENLQKIIKQAWMEKDGQNLQPFALIGLHTCGDLCAALLRIFLEISEAQVLLSVGCCYMKLSTGRCCGFPLSNLVNELSISLSPEAREIACHALEKYVKRLKENAESLKIHCYRAILEKIIVKQDSSMRHLGLKGIKHAEKMKFHEYATKALENVSITVSDVEGLFDDMCHKEWKNVVAIYSLRLLIAPVIESLILLDRMVFLHEKGLQSCVIPIFNPSISPRNHLLFSLKYC